MSASAWAHAGPHRPKRASAHVALSHVALSHVVWRMLTLSGACCRQDNASPPEPQQPHHAEVRCVARGAWRAARTALPCAQGTAMQPKFRRFRRSMQHACKLDRLHVSRPHGTCPPRPQPKHSVMPTSRSKCVPVGLAPATSAPGLSSPLPHLHRDWAHSCRRKCLGRLRSRRGAGAAPLQRCTGRLTLPLGPLHGCVDRRYY